MKLDYKKFKKISGDKHHTILAHPDGHEIKVAHSGLSKDMRKQLDAIPKMAEGGEVDQQDVPDRGWGKIIFKAEGGDVEGDSTFGNLSEDQIREQAASGARFGPGMLARPMDVSGYWLWFKRYCSIRY